METDETPTVDRTADDGACGDVVTGAADRTAAVPVDGDVPPAGLRLGRVAAAVAAAIVVVCAVSWLRAPAGYAVTAPGPMTDLRQAVSVADGLAGLDPDFRDRPPLWMTTVDESALTNGGWLLTKLPWSTTHVASLAGDIPFEQRPAHAHIRMRQSQRTSVAVAARMARRPAPPVSGLQISATVAGTPADRADVRIGETVTTVDGRATTSVAAFDQAVAAAAGDLATFALTIGRDTRQVEVAVPSATRTGRELGFVVDEFYDSVGLDFDIEAVSGGSGGLMMTLAILDLLTNGPLATVPLAGTGTVAADGTVGYVAGAPAKAEAAAAAGAAVFFAPADTEVAEEVAGMPVVKVVSVEDAVAWLCDNGGVGACG